MVPIVVLRARKAPLDITVTTIAANENSWGMTDLLGRDMGTITETHPGAFKIRPAGKAVETFADIVSRSYPSLDSALAAIEEHTRGVCRRAPEGS
jgi:hypothetical protein